MTQVETSSGPGAGDIAAALGVRSPVRASGTYVTSWVIEDNSGYLRLDRNELTGPLSSTVSQAVATYLDHVGAHLYPEVAALTIDLAAYAGVGPDAVIPTNGSDHAIDVTLRTFLGNGSRMLVATPEFPMFPQFAGVLGIETVPVPYPADLSFPYDEFRRRARETAPDLIVLINPNNPTGTPVDVEFIEDLAQAHPTTPVVVDEAYVEFTGRTAVPLIAEHENVVILRTLSKAFGLAGLRVGYVVAAPSIARHIAKLVGPYDVNALAIAAARAQLAALDEVQARVASIMAVKPEVEGFLRSVGEKTWPGAANFFLVRPAAGPSVIDTLRAQKILVRLMRAPALAGTYRISMGTAAEMAHFMDVYRASCLT